MTTYQFWQDQARRWDIHNPALMESERRSNIELAAAFICRASVTNRAAWSPLARAMLDSGARFFDYANGAPAGDSHQSAGDYAADRIKEGAHAVQIHDTKPRVLYPFTVYRRGNGSPVAVCGTPYRELQDLTKEGAPC